MIASLIIFSDYLNTIYHFNLELFMFVGFLQVLKFEFLKFRILEISNFHPCVGYTLKKIIRCCLKGKKMFY